MADYIKDFGDYSVKNVKNFMGREGYGFNCTLYRNGKKVGTCIDDASGGGMYPVDWDRKVDRKEEQRLLNEHIKSLPKVQYSSERELTVDEGLFVSELVNKFEKDKEVRKVKRQCESKTLFRTKDQREGQYYIINFPFDQRVKDHIIKNNGTDVEIFNEVFAKGEIPSVVA
jgi:hypothetical protein